MNRTFHSRTRWDQIIYVFIIASVCLYMIWIKQAILAAILAVLLIVLIEKIIHTQYIITSHNKLIIKRGRFSKTQELDFDNITDIEEKTTTKFGAFYVAKYVLITYNKNKYIAITPASPSRFINAVIKKKEHYIDNES